MASAKVVWRDGEQIILFPETFWPDSDEVTIRREGQAIILEPVQTKVSRAPGSEPGPERDSGQ